MAANEEGVRVEQVDREADEAYEIGKREGYEAAIQDLDLATGGDGEYKGCWPEGTVDMPVMKARIIERFNSLASQPPAAAGVDLKRFADDVQDVQSRIIIVHQLRASADIQDRETKRVTGWADTSDRAQLMRKAANVIEALASADPSPFVDCAGEDGR